jgi:hypothetical protein
LTILACSKLKLRKFCKHEEPYASVGFNFSPFVGSYFGAFGKSTVRYLWSLAWLEQHQNATTRSSQGLDPLDDAERAQFRDRCYHDRHSSAGVGAAMAKAKIPAHHDVGLMTDMLSPRPQLCASSSSFCSVGCPSCCSCWKLPRQIILLRQYL